MTYYCEVCNKNYSSRQSLWSHKNKYHNTEDTLNKGLKKKTTTCDYCDKTFSTTSNLTRHLTSCKKKPLPEKKPDAITNEAIFMEVVKNLIPKVVGNNSGQTKDILNFLSENNPGQKHSQNHNNNSLNTNTINSNNNIQIITLGNENLSEVLSLNEKVNILKQKTESLEAIIRHVHFNKKYPQFHNIAITEEGDGFKYDPEEKEFKETPKDDLILDLIENRMNDIYDFSQEAKGNISQKTYGIIENLGSKFTNPNYQQRKSQSVEGVVMEGTNNLVTNKKIKLRLRDE